jgi:hypothetical protein
LRSLLKVKKKKRFTIGTLKNKGTDKMIKCEQEDIYRELVNKADNKEHYRSLIREHTQQEDINEELLTDIWNEYCPQGQ